MKPKVYLTGHCSNEACKHPIQNKRVNGTFINASDLASSTCKFCEIGTVSWGELRVREPNTGLWLIVALISVILLFSSVAYYRLHRSYSPTEMATAQRFVNNQPANVLLRGLPGGVAYKSRLFGVSPSIIRKIEQRELFPTPLFDSVIRGAGVQYVLDGEWFVFRRHHFFYSPFATTTEFPATQ